MGSGGRTCRANRVNHLIGEFLHSKKGFTMFTTRKIFAIAIFVLLIPNLLFAQEGKYLKQIVKRGELRIGTSGTQPPFTAKSKNGDLMGYEIELAMMLIDAMNLKVKFVEKPFSELLPALEKGEIDVVMSGMTITPERNMNYTFVGPYMVSGKSVLAKKSRISQLDEIGELKKGNIKIVALEGSTSQQFAETVSPSATLVLTKDYDSAVKMVLDNSVDLMVADLPICVLSILRNPDADLATLDVPLTLEPIGMALPANAFQLYNLIENFLVSLEISGVLENLEIKWFNDGAWLIRLP
jgi:polar amino acid transport system substrate-binding protein